jgi:glutathione S-transferase
MEAGLIKVYGHGPAFGLPDPSAFVVKTLVLLQMAGVPYEMVRGDPRKGPKRKIPWIDDGGRLVPDSTFIRLHLEDTRGVDFDSALSAEQRGMAWGIEKMLEDHVYWLLVTERWFDRANFEKGPREYFAEVPAILRPVVLAIVNRQVRRSLDGHGIGRHAPAEIERLAERAALALSQCVGTKPWLMGETPCGADATAYAMISNAMCPLFDGPVQRAFERHDNLKAYVARGTARWFAKGQG